MPVFFDVSDRFNQRREVRFQRIPKTEHIKIEIVCPIFCSRKLLHRGKHKGAAAKKRLAKFFKFRQKLIQKFDRAGFSAGITQWTSDHLFAIRCFFPEPIDGIFFEIKFRRFRKAQPPKTITTAVQYHRRKRPVFYRADAPVWVVESSVGVFAKPDKQRSNVN